MGVKRTASNSLDRQGGSAGDELVNLMNRYEQPLLNYLWVLLGRWDLAQDCAQDTFLRAYKHLCSGRPVQGAWLYRVARNRAVDELRSGRRQVADVDLVGYVMDEAASPETDEVFRALARLSAEDRELLYLFDIDGFSGAEIADMVGTTRGAIHVRVYRARERFRTLYRSSEGQE